MSEETDGKRKRPRQDGPVSVTEPEQQCSVPAAGPGQQMAASGAEPSKVSQDRRVAQPCHDDAKRTVEHLKRMFDC